MVQIRSFSFLQYLIRKIKFPGSTSCNCTGTGAPTALRGLSTLWTERSSLSRSTSCTSTPSTSTRTALQPTTTSSNPMVLLCSGCSTRSLKRTTPAWPTFSPRWLSFWRHCWKTWWVVKIKTPSKVSDVAVEAARKRKKGRAGPVALDMNLALETLLPADTRHYYHYQVNQWVNFSLELIENMMSFEINQQDVKSNRIYASGRLNNSNL